MDCLMWPSASWEDRETGILLWPWLSVLMYSMWHVLSEACGVLEKYIINVQGQIPNLIIIVKNLLVSSHCNVIDDNIRKISFVYTSKTMIPQDIYRPALETHIGLNLWKLLLGIYPLSHFHICCCDIILWQLA